jgi:hypothetical protein
MRHMWTWLAHESTTDHVSLVVSILAFAVAVLGWYQTKRSASATIKQARAAVKQAQVASDQLWQSIEASNQAEKAAKEAKVVTWHDINDRLMERAARVVVGVENIELPPILVESFLDEPEYPRCAEPDQPKILNYRHDRLQQLYYWVRGVIINEDVRSIQFIPLGGMELIEGETSLISGEIKIPPKMHPEEGRYLLAPGKSALFEWRATLAVEFWMEIYKAERALALSTGVFAYPAGDPETATYIRIELEDACALVDCHTGNEKWQINDNNGPYVQVRPPRLVPPKALTQLLLTLDESGEAWKDLRTWELDPWQRDFLNLW